jgi:hypothetical protein
MNFVLHGATRDKIAVRFGKRDAAAAYAKAHNAKDTKWRYSVKKDGKDYLVIMKPR